ncbi:O-methyltransferase [Infundibulicybe gibba]|nr:O-methyltransferase [Infundibulicybe gibba]
MTLQDIQRLREIINSSLDSLERLYTSSSLNFPSLDESYVHNSEEETLSASPPAAEAINLIISATYQLMSTVRHPFLTLANASTVYHLPACLRVAEKFNVPEILREAGPSGLTVGAIAEEAGIEVSKLGRVMRLLATHHIFREIEPDRFANNRISSYFDTGNKSVLLRLGLTDKYNDGLGAAAAGYIGTTTDDGFKASSYLLEHLEDSEFGRSFSANKAAFQKAFSTDQVYFSWLENADNRYRLKRYMACIRGTSLWDDPGAILRAFDWGSLAKGSLIVDVGGGSGFPAMVVARAHPELKIIIQDRESVKVEGMKIWQNSFPLALSSGQVTFQVHNFFEPQPPNRASIFLVRTVCHDWPDDRVVKLLRNLRTGVCIPNAKLILADYVIPYACPTMPAGPNQSPATVGNEPDQVQPQPLLANLGKASANAYFIDMTMQVLLNGQERTLLHQIRLASQAGWRVISTTKIPNSHFGYIIAEPAETILGNHV